MASKLGSNSGSSIENVARALLFEIMPIVFLEGFGRLNLATSRLAWPKNPTVIFTSNHFYTDEIFKVWVANKVSGGTKYVIGQHGNHYGSHRYKYPSVAEQISDAFITWGWCEDPKLHIPSFVFKTAGRRQQRYNPQGQLLLAQSLIGHRSTTWDNFEEYDQHFSNQYKFLNGLATEPRRQVIIRLHSWSSRLQWCDKSRWRDYDRSLQIDDGVQKFSNLISKCRLVVYTTDTTGIIELINSSIPMLAFWDGGLDHLRESAKPFYSSLMDAEILFTCPHAASAKVNSIWEDPQLWWESDNVVAAREFFASNYARESNFPSYDLAKILSSF